MRLTELIDLLVAQTENAPDAEVYVNGSAEVVDITPVSVDGQQAVSIEVDFGLGELDIEQEPGDDYELEDSMGELYEDAGDYWREDWEVY